MASIADSSRDLWTGAQGWGRAAAVSGGRLAGWEGWRRGDSLKAEGGMAALRDLLQMKVEELEKVRQSEDRSRQASVSVVV